MPEQESMPMSVCLRFAVEYSMLRVLVMIHSQVS